MEGVVAVIAACVSAASTPVGDSVKLVFAELADVAADIVALELTVLIELDKEVDAIGEHAVAPPPDRLIEELLQVRAVEVGVVED